MHCQQLQDPFEEFVVLFSSATSRLCARRAAMLKTTAATDWRWQEATIPSRLYSRISGELQPAQITLGMKPGRYNIAQNKLERARRRTGQEELRVYADGERWRHEQQKFPG